MPSQKPTIVFVPGWFFGTAVYIPVKKILEDAGYATTVVAMPSAGTSSPGNPDWYDDADAVRKVVESLVEDRGDDIVMVCHSSGGAIGAQAVQGLTKKTRSTNGTAGGVCCFVFLSAAIFPKDFLPTFDLLPWIDIQNGKLLCKDPHNTFFNDFADEEASPWLQKSQCQPAGDYVRRVTFTGWADVPSTYVVAELDQAVPVPVQEAGATMAGSKVVRLNVGHMSMIRDSVAIADIIKSANAQS